MKNTEMKEANVITLKPVSGKEIDLSKFLTAGADLVAQTEPKTLLWAALRDEKEMVIFDTFADNSGREAHFAGKVAAALNENAESLVFGGWDDGVIPNIKNAKILSGKSSNDASDMKVAVFIPVKAKEGQSKTLANFLSSAAEIVEETEPKTRYWFALQFSENEFGIIDYFADESGIEAHFAGKVAAAVQENAQVLLEGGWENGVLANIRQFDVLAMISK